MTFKDPAAKLAYERDLHRRKMREAELTVPPHRCEFAGGCDTLTRIAGIGANKYGRRNRFCRQHATLARDPGMVATRARVPIVLAKRPGYGPNPRSQRLQINRNISAGQKGKKRGPWSPARRARFEQTRATRKTPSADYMRLILDAAALDGKNATDLLILEYRQTAPDAQRFVRKHLRGLSRRHPAYRLQQVHDYLLAGLSRSAIGRKLRLSERRAREVIALVRSLDATPTAP